MSSENKDLLALNALVDEVMEKETSLSSLSQQLAVQSQQFASYLEQQKRQQDELQVLKDAIKEYMQEHNISEHDTGKVLLKLSSTGRYSADDISTVPDELCKIVRQLDNAKVKAYKELNGALPEGVRDAGYRLTMKVKE